MAGRTQSTSSACEDDEEEGCACTASPTPATAVVWLAATALGVGGLRRRVARGGA